MRSSGVQFSMMLQRVQFSENFLRAATAVACTIGCQMGVGVGVGVAVGAGDGVATGGLAAPQSPRPRCCRGLRRLGPLRGSSGTAARRGG